MIARQAKIRNFSESLKYHKAKLELENKEHRAVILENSFSSLDESGIRKELQMVRCQRPGLGQYAYHTSLNFHPGDKLSNEQMLSIARDYMSQFGFTNHQHIIIRHHDADHPHLHILANRIGYDGSLVSERHDYQRSARICRELEEKYQLMRAPQRELSERRGVSNYELERVMATGEPTEKMMLQEIMGGLIDKNLKLDEFIREAEKKNVRLHFHYDRDRKVNGITYFYNDKCFRGQGLGNAYKWKNLSGKLEYHHCRHERLVSKVNERTEQKFGRLTRQEQGQKQEERPEMENRRTRSLGYRR